ncbi:mercuric ion transporter MerT [Thauera aminoaromatica]|jgi:mercuric ion transport protein|uniref:Mercuric transport protein MerT n=1 Tax=Thauera aminoaromatica TaxID=164330 RepID=A0A5C7T8R1_THASP|nr:mercuric ion transporter MerT [Thauera aminoaromatica]TXH92062.1 MAG: mercuric ion transporter MerT [Thauera aminoaromatica]HET7772753.1 mercuric ion transporter MerT [Burkholderiaceae bacterium]HOX68854.1 mercuric ion transporter MerT [Burkholderiaceae bacterium]
MGNRSPASTPTSSGSERGPLLAGALAALLATSCCLGPLVLLSLGVSGAWIGNLTALEPWRPLFIAVALAALALAARRIWRRVPDCAPGDVCAVPRVRRRYQGLFFAVALLVLLALAFPWFAPLFY